MSENSDLRDGEPCGHIGCLNHVTHPCEGCGRIAGRAKSDLRERAREKSREVTKKWATDWLTENRIWQSRGYDFGNHVATIITNLLAALDDAEREERERCARIAETGGMNQDVCGYCYPSEAYANGKKVAEGIAAAIRREGGRDE